MGIEKVNVAANNYLKNAEFVFDQNEQEQQVVDVTQKPVPQAKTGEQILKESETLPKGYALEKSNETPVDKYKQNGDKMMQEIEASMKKAGVKPKSLEYSGTPEDFKTPKTVEEAKYRYRQMIYNGQMDKMSDEEIDEQAKLYIENKERKEKFDNTHTYLDKAEYKKAEAEKDAYYKQLRKNGVSKDEAKAKAYEKFGENKYMSKGGLFGIGKSSARKFIERNQDLFYENGKYSEAKHKEYVLEQAQRGNKDEGEATNYRYSLKERRVATEQQRLEGRRTNVHQQGEVAKVTGISTENNNTTLYRGLAIGGATALLAGVGLAIGGIVVSSTSGSASGAGAVAGAGAASAAGTAGAGAGATSGAIAGALASVTIPAEYVAGAGAVVGAAAGSGLSHFLRDNGEKIKHVRRIKNPTLSIEVPPVQVSFVKLPPKQPVKPEPCFEDAYCDSIDTIKSGDNWSKRILAGKGVTINGVKLGYDSKESRALLNAYIHAEKLQYGITDMTSNSFISQYRKDENGNKVANKFRYYTNFDNLLNNEEIMRKHPELELLRNAKIVPDCDAVTKACKSGSPKKPYHSAGIPTDHKIPCE